jgi:hypothetical protein
MFSLYVYVLRVQRVNSIASSCCCESDLLPKCWLAQVNCQSDKRFTPQKKTLPHATVVSSHWPVYYHTYNNFVFILLGGESGPATWDVWALDNMAHTWQVYTAGAERVWSWKDNYPPSQLRCGQCTSNWYLWFSELWLLRLLSFVMWSCVVCLIDTNVVEEPSASMFRAATLQIKVAGSIETLVLVYNTMWFNFPEECILTHYLFGSNVTHLVSSILHVYILHLFCRVENNLWDVTIKWHYHVICVISCFMRRWPKFISLRKVWKTCIEHKMCCSFLCKFSLNYFPPDICLVSCVWITLQNLLNVPNINFIIFLFNSCWCSACTPVVYMQGRGTKMCVYLPGCK